MKALTKQITHCTIQHPEHLQMTILFSYTQWISKRKSSHLAKSNDFTLIMIDKWVEPWLTYSINPTVTDKWMEPWLTYSINPTVADKWVEPLLTYSYTLHFDWQIGGATTYLLHYSSQWLTGGWSHAECPVPDCVRPFQSSGCLRLKSVNKRHTNVKNTATRSKLR